MSRRTRDQFISQLSERWALLYDPDVGQWILARDRRHDRSKCNFEGVAFWRSGILHLDREIRRRAFSVSVDASSQSLKALALDLHFLQRGEQTSQELVFG